MDTSIAGYPVVRLRAPKCLDRIDPGMHPNLDADSGKNHKCKEIGARAEDIRHLHDSRNNTDAAVASTMRRTV